MEAIILAGGLGTRLQTVISEIPKSMAMVNHRPFLEYLLDYIIDQGVNKVVLSVGYKREFIIGHFKNQYRSLKISYAVEEEPLGTGGGTRLSFWHVDGDRAFVLNGDSMFRLDYRQLMAEHLRKKSAVTIALRKLNDTGRFGKVCLNRNHRSIGFTEKEINSGPGYINGGVYIIEKKSLMEPEFRGKFSIEKDYFERCYKENRMFGFPSKDYFLDIGVPEDYKKAQHDFKGFGN